MARLHGLTTFPESDCGLRGWLVVWFVTAVLALVVQVVNLVRVGFRNGVARSAAQSLLNH